MAYIENPNNIGTNAEVSGDAYVYGNAQVSGNARVYGNAYVSGNADIESNNDWFSFIYQGKTLTGYRSRNDLGYELNINGSAIDDFLGLGLDIVVVNLIKEFTPRKNPEKEKIRSIITDLESQLEDAKNRLKDL